MHEVFVFYLKLFLVHQHIGTHFGNTPTMLNLTQSTWNTWGIFKSLICTASKVVLLKFVSRLSFVAFNRRHKRKTGPSHSPECEHPREDVKQDRATLVSLVSQTCTSIAPEGSHLLI